jgi:transposase-like protein
MSECPKCHSRDIIKNGRHLGRQRHRCKACGFQFTRSTLRGKPAKEKAVAVLLYTLGLSLNSIARIFHVSTSAVLRWIRNFAEQIYEKSEPKETVNNCRQRHWFARFKRKSIVVSKSLHMVDLTMALFARFHVNGVREDIVTFFLPARKMPDL